MNDYYAQLRIQQGRLKAAMIDAGIDNVAQLSRSCGVNRAVIDRLLNFKASAVNKRTGEYRDTALRICNSLNVSAENIFPTHLQHEIVSNRITSFIDSAQLSGYTERQLTPCDQLQNKEAKVVIDEAFNTLSKRERNVLKARFWDGQTRAQCAKVENVSETMISFIEHRALRKLRHPVRLNKLSEVCEFQKGCLAGPYHAVQTVAR